MLESAFQVARPWLESVLAVVFPSSCSGCGCLLDHPSRGPLCERCWMRLPRHRAPLCSCGGPCGAAAVCGRCRRGLNTVTRGASLGPYEGLLRTLVHELKYQGQRRIAVRLAEILAKTPAATHVLSPGAVLVPVPLHPARRRARGFNQSELLAETLSRLTGLPLVEGVLVRHRDTAPQTGLTAAGRRANLVGAFAVTDRTRVARQTVVLIDDVVTTGATVQACARSLMAAGAAEVRLVAAARAL